MQRSDIETELGKINFAYRKGDPLVVFLMALVVLIQHNLFQK